MFNLEKDKKLAIHVEPKGAVFIGDARETVEAYCDRLVFGNVQHHWYIMASCDGQGVSDSFNVRVTIGQEDYVWEGTIDELVNKLRG